MEKNDFMLLPDNIALEYIVKHYDIDDINDACEDFLDELSNDYDEDEFDELVEKHSPFEIVQLATNGDELKDFLWSNIIEWCEEVE